MIVGKSPSKMQAKRPVSRAAALITAAAVAISAGPARAQTSGIPVIRDAEIEQLLREYTAPIMRVAGLTQQNIHIVIINEKSFNAFVMDAHRIFVNSGALMQATVPNQLIGVFAHETGHIVGGHLSKMRQELATAQTAAIVAMLVGVGASQSYLQHTLLAYQRAQEEQADRAGVRFLTMTGQSAKGMYDTFKRFADEMMFTSAYIDPYVQNHPMPTERMAALAELVKTPYWDKKDPAELQFRHDMMRAKLYGFTERADVVSRHYPASDTSLPARYAHAITSYRFGDVRSALTQIEGLIQAKPNYPYFYELEGQALLEAGHPADAIAPLRHAVELAPNPALIQILLAQAMIATNNPKTAEEAVPLLRAALVKEPESSDAYEQLAMAYGHNKNFAEADLASAEAAFARGDNKTARELAARAKTRFPVGSPGWVKADDIVAFNKGKSPLLFGQ
jgi:predicted Zn-dependent protease